MDTGVRFFTTLVKLDSVTDELKPGMTAMVDFRLSRRRDVLAIPHQAVRTDRGKKVCFVAHDETLERRVVKIGQDTAEMVEVLDGLQEGEMVALDPPGITTNVEQLLSFDEPDSPRNRQCDDIATLIDRAAIDAMHDGIPAATQARPVIRNQTRQEYSLSHYDRQPPPRHALSLSNFCCTNGLIGCA